MKKLINGELVDLTAEEIAERNADIKKSKEEDAQILADKEVKENLKLSAKTKLMNGETLTEDEANVMVGL
tara:strand:- start:1050 stop:1259 length:210 start_codon:yes stop_codon:yes gene_type:complete